VQEAVTKCHCQGLFVYATAQGEEEVERVRERVRTADERRQVPDT